MTTITDTDKGGQGFQKQRVYLGPSLGWSEEFVQPQSKVITGGTYTVQPGDGLLLVDASAPVTIQLPDVVKWWQQNADQPATGWNRQLCIKDFGGHAATNNITILPFGSQNIDKVIGSTVLNVNLGVILLVPNSDLSGWILAAGTTTLDLVGTFLPINNPAATGMLTVGPVGGNRAVVQGSAAGQQQVFYGVDPSSADAAVNTNVISKGGGSLVFSNNGGVNQVIMGGPALANRALTLSGSNGGNPTISTLGGGHVSIPDLVMTGAPTAPTAPFTATNGEVITADYVKTNNLIQGVAPFPGTLFDKLAGFTDVNYQIQAISMPPSGLGRSGPNLVFKDDLLALENLTGTNTIYYRSGASAWSPVIIGGNLTFVGGVLDSVAGGGGNVSAVGSPTNGQWAQWTSGTTIQGVAASATGFLVLNTANTVTAPTIIQGTAGVVLNMEFYSAVTGGPVYQLRHSRGPSVGAMAAVQSGDTLGTIVFGGSDGSAFVQGTSIASICLGAPSAGHVPTRMSFTTDDGTTAAERMRINPSGGVSLAPPFVDPGVGNLTALKLTATQSLNGPLSGVADSSSAAAGLVGEYQEQIKTSSTALTSATITDVTTLTTLTAGDWDVWAHSLWNTSGTAGTAELELSTTSQSLTGGITKYAICNLPLATGQFVVDLPIVQFRLTGPTTMFLVARSGAAGMSIPACYIKARRTR